MSYLIAKELFPERHHAVERNVVQKEWLSCLGLLRLHRSDDDRWRVTLNGAAQTEVQIIRDT